MKFRKPQLNEATAGAFYREACERFVAELPAEFEIVPEGHVCVKWPSEAHKENLNYAARYLSYNASASEARAKHYLFILAAIAPERKKRRVNIWMIGGDPMPYAKPTDWTPSNSIGTGWRKVGECEIEE